MTLSRILLGARLALVTALMLSASFELASAQKQTAGLSPALSAAPPYTCVTNYYVSAATGNDSNPGTQAQPWKTISNADNGYPNTPKAGECVNVLPGTYTLVNPIIFAHGGNLNSPTGYVVYRSTVPQAAHIIAGPGFQSGNGDLIMLWAPFIIIDGFEIDGNKSLANGTGIDGCADGGGPTALAHHFTAINNIIHDMGLAGLTSCTVDHILWEHNVVYNNSSTNPFQGSGMSVWRPQMTNEKTYTQSNADFAPFAIEIEYNIAHNNGEGPSITATHTDGNGIIIDTTLNSDTCTTCGTPYPGKILVLGNLSYSNGGGGVHVFLSKNVTVANNTVYNNYLDPLNPGARGDLNNVASINNTFINNIAVAVPGAGPLANNAPIVTYSLPGFQESSTWTKNIAFGASVQMDAISSANASTDLVGVNPMLTNPAGSEFTPLPGSPAIGAGQSESYVPYSPPNIGAY